MKLVKLERESVQVTSLCCGFTLSHLKSFLGATSDSFNSRKKGNKVVIFFFDVLFSYGRETDRDVDKDVSGEFPWFLDITVDWGK